MNFSFLCINQKGSDVIYSFSNETVVKSTTNSVSIVTGWYKKGHLYAVVNIVTLKKKKNVNKHKLQDHSSTKMLTKCIHYK